MLDPQSWRHHTEGLPLGGRLRAEHDCGPGSGLLVSHKPDGFSAWCFRCGEPGFIAHPRKSMAEKLADLARVRDADLELASRPALPEPRVDDPQEWPSHAAVWLYKAGFSNDDIASLGAYWNPRMQRVVIPVWQSGELVYWQARGFNPARPKYINPPVDRATLCAKYPGRQHSSVLVLTEDILSAYRVARLTSAWSLMGTALPLAVALDAAQQGVPIVVMLDPDRAGKKGNSQAAQVLRSMGARVTIALPPRDPKYLTVEGTLSCLLESDPSLQPLLPLSQ